MRKILMATSALLLLGSVPGIAQDDSAPTVWRPLAQGEPIAAGDCVEVGPGEFEASDESDEPTPDNVKCPEGMMPANPMTTGATGADGTIEPEAGEFEPSDESDEPVPDPAPQ